MSWTLWRYATIELWRLVLLSAAVLVVVIAFAVAVKPLADGTLGPAEALRFMALASVPMLAYALPFAAAFGATLAYHRMAQDNEVIAALAGGLSHRALLVPALASGLALGGILTALNEQIIPRFLQSMEQMVTRDAIETLVNKIDRGESATVGGMTVHAEGVRRLEIKPGEPLVGKILLERVAAVETDDFGAVTNDATAEYALVMLMPGEAVGADDALAGRIAFNNGTLYRDGTLGV
ncbi:MAG: LptF/LptG family permease, partial [Planctomycetota bacterium]